MKLTLLTFTCVAALASAASKKPDKSKNKKPAIVSLGPRPYFLIDSMEPSSLKTKLGKFEVALSGQVLGPV
jgi:hypothetical protein